LGLLNRKNERYFFYLSFSAVIANSASSSDIFMVCDGQPFCTHPGHTFVHVGSEDSNVFRYPVELEIQVYCSEQLPFEQLGHYFSAI